MPIEVHYITTTAEARPGQTFTALLEAEESAKLKARANPGKTIGVYRLVAAFELQGVSEIAVTEPPQV